MLSKRTLFAGVSMAALNAVLAAGMAGMLAPTAVEAACLGVSNQLVHAGATGCLNWSGTTLTVSNTGTITASEGGYAVNYSGSGGTLTNQGTITGIAEGLLNSGSISTLTNSGLIEASSDYAVYNSGSSNIGTLHNTGTITSNFQGVRNTGIIGALINEGTIKASVAIDNNGSGAIGTITNTGLIAGAINNVTTNGLTIAGGTSISQMGTLTGSSGSIGAANKGTITNTASNLVFSSGYLLLNDDITATGRTVFNTGAHLRLDNAITITGNYSQTGGALIINAPNGTVGYGSLKVTGNAAVSGATITISGAHLNPNQQLTIVDSDGTGTYGFNTVVMASTNGLGATLSTISNDLVMTLRADSANTFATKGKVAGGNAAPVGAVLDKIQAANPNGVFQTQILDKIDLLPAASQGDAIKQLAPTRNAPASQMSNAATTAVLGAVEQHQQTAMAYDPVTGVATGSEARDSAIWGQFLGGGARRGSNSEADGYNLWDFGLATGIDHRFSTNVMGGAALSWVRAWSSGSDNSSGSFSTLDSYQLTLYGTYRLDRAFIDGQAGFGWNEFDQKRAIGFLGSTASAQYSGQQYLAKATIGYDLPVTEKVTVTPLASLRWMRSVTGAYGEDGAGAANLSVDRHSVNSVSQDLGAKVSWDVPTSFGLLKPEARLAWVHDYTDGPIATSAVLGGQAITTTVPRTEADGIKIGLAASLSGDDAMSFRVEYEGELRSQYQSHTGLVKAIWGF